MVAGQELQQGHSTWSRDTKNFPRCTAAIEHGGSHPAVREKLFVDSKGSASDIPALPDKTLCALHVSCDVFPAVTGCVMSLNSSFASPVTFHTF